MARYLIIDGGVVTNAVEADSVFAESVGAVMATDTEVGIGWMYDGNEFTPPPAQPLPVPQSVTMRQARLALLASGKLALVDAAIEALPEPQRAQAQIEWEFASEILRVSPLVEAMGVALGLDDAALDALFTEAAVL